jgi:hypothetical protein
LKEKKIVISIIEKKTSTRDDDDDEPEVSDYTYSSIFLEYQPRVADSFAACSHL